MTSAQLPQRDRIRVFIVDDHPVVREGIAERIRREQGWSVCGEAEDGPGAIDMVRKRAPDLATVDLTLKTGGGLELIKTLKSIRPKLKVVVVSMHDEALYAERAIRAGASGYVSKQEPMSEIVRAIRTVLAGDIAVSEGFGRKVLQDWAESTPKRGSKPVESLSDRELEILRLIGGGLATRQIAAELNIGVKTVETYRLRLKKKLKLTSAAALVRYAARNIEG